VNYLRHVCCAECGKFDSEMHLLLKILSESAERGVGGFKKIGYGAVSFWPIMWAAFGGRSGGGYILINVLQFENFSFLGWHVIGITRVPPLALSQKFTQIHKMWYGWR